jgi:histidinol-phosphate/aromatic aminotransferase/cobyric acid decarboxylase-like protein
VAAPGTQILLPLVGLVAPGRARVLGPTYAEHARAAALAGHAVEEVSDLRLAVRCRSRIVVNPNNPDGRILSRQAPAGWPTMRARGGLLVVDEAFMDVGPVSESLCGDVGQENIVVLRSFGKFFGLAGLRLGFAVANPEIASRLEGLLGPWAVSGRRWRSASPRWAIPPGATRWWRCLKHDAPDSTPCWRMPALRFRAARASTDIWNSTTRRAFSIIAAIVA